MDQVQQFATNVTSMAFHALDVIEEHTGLPPVVFFTILALLVGAYFLISGTLAPSQITALPVSPSVTLEEEPKPLRLGVISVAELAEYDGRSVDKPLLMAIKGQIYDVSSARDFYGPGGPYSIFAGKDASRALAKMTFEEKDLCGDLGGLSEAELGTLREWEERFCSKYTKVGALESEQGGGEGEQAAKRNVVNVEVTSPEDEREERPREESTTTTTTDDKEGGEGPTASGKHEGESQEKQEAEEREFEMVDKVKSSSSDGEESGVTSLDGLNSEKDGTVSSGLGGGLRNQSATAAAT